jgi:uncharacterized membrane protein
MNKKYKDKSDARPLYSDSFTFNDNVAVNLPAENDVNKVLNKSSEVSRLIPSTSESKITSSSDDLNTPKPTIPKIYQFKLRKELRQQLIKQYIETYSKPIRINVYDEKLKQDKSIYYQEDARSITEYKKEIEKLSLKDLVHMQKITLYEEYKYTLIESFSKFNKKKRVIIRIINNNNTITDYVISKHLRFFRIRDGNYLKIAEYALYDTKYDMMCWIYYENNPFPIKFQNDYHPIDNQGRTIPDAPMLRKSEKFEYAEQLASSRLASNVNIAMIFSILSFIVGLICLVITLMIANNLEII